MATGAAKTNTFLGERYTRRIDLARRTNHLTRQLQALGYNVQLTPTKTA
jgi:hypothetical protein